MNLFSTPFLSLLGIFSGILFGFLLRKATVSRFDTIVNQLLLRDFTVMKVILTAIVVGSVGIYSMKELGLVPTMHLSTTPLLWSLLGGGIFGIGMSVAGYCPGTGLTAIAEGSKDMITGFVGMLFGSLIFNELSSIILPLQQPDTAHQKTIASFFDLSHSIVIACTVAVWVVFVVAMKRLGRKKSHNI